MDPTSYASPGPSANRGPRSARRGRQIIGHRVTAGPAWISHAESTASHDVQVRLERPQVSIVSSKHYINLGGSEMVVYRATPADVTSGVLVGDLEYPGYPASGASTIEGVKFDDPSLRIAFFALRYDQDLKTPIRLFARDEAGNTARARLRLHDISQAVQEEQDSDSTTSSSIASSLRSWPERQRSNRKETTSRSSS